MRPSHLLVLLLAVHTLAVGCRSTRDADDGELASLQLVSDSFWSSQDANTDQGEVSVGQLSGNYSLLMALSTESSGDEDAAGSDGMAIGLRPADAAFGAWLQSGQFLSDEREEWPECITEEDGGVSYDECGYAFSGGDGSISFLVDGSYHWSDQAADADLTYDFSVGSSNLSWDWMLHWGMDFEWTDTVINGVFDMNYSYGVSLGSSPSLGGATFDLEATVTDLTADESCEEGPVAGTIDWTSVLLEGFNQPEKEHVTIEWEGCGQATIKM